MKNWTIKHRLVFLVGCFLANIVIVQLVGRWTGAKLEHALDRSSMVYIPAVRMMGTADMMHDGLRAVAYQSIIVSGEADATIKQEIETEYKEMTTTLSESLDGLSQLNLPADIQDGIAAAGPAVANYKESVGKIVKVSLSGDRAGALQLMPEVQEAFEGLEAALEKFSERIELGAQSTIQESKEAEQLGSFVGMTVLLVSLLFGVLNAWWSIADISRLLNSVISKLREESQKLANTSQDVSRTATSVSTSTTHQAEALQETAASIEEMSSMIKRTAENADQSRDVARRAEAESQRGQQTVQDLIHAIREISSSNDVIGHKTEESNRQISEIVKVIEEIGAKTRVINDIVFQTKLLSFNASVEAARAGEHGKGFAVVAEEVGNLAQMSGNAAKEISDMLGNSTQHVQDIVSKTKSEIERLMTQNKSKVEAGTRVAKDCGEVLTVLGQGVVEVVRRVDEISTATREQATGVSEITKAMNQLDSVTHANSSASRQGSASAEELSHEAENLLGAVQELERLVGGPSSAQSSSKKAKAPAAPKVSLKPLGTPPPSDEGHWDDMSSKKVHS